MTVTNLRVPIVITLPRQGAGNAPEPGNFTIEEKRMTTHKITIQDPNYSFHATVYPGLVNSSGEFRMFFRADSRPTTEAYDFNWTADISPSTDDLKQGFRLSVSNLQLKNLNSSTGVYYLGFYVDVDSDSSTYQKCAELSYNLSSFFASCTFWDEKNEKWEGSGCEVSLVKWTVILALLS